ncbi:MAG: alpha/beta hydrolase [Pseudomonadota bacterium]
MSEFLDVDAWQQMDTASLEQQYSPSSCVSDFPALIAAYSESSREAELRARVLKDLKYGEPPDEALDFFPAGEKSAPLHVFIHGGYWQELSKNESTFPGADFVANGVAFAAINYTLAPEASIGEMVAQCRRSIAWLFQNAVTLGFDSDRIFVSGSSAGAQLASMVLLTPWENYGLPADVIKGATLMSGVYDLRPICHTYVNDPLHMDEEEAIALSPLFMDLAGMPPAIICWGENETDEFKRQSRAFSDAWQKAGNHSATFEVPDVNHFDIVHTLSDPNSVLGRSVYAQLRAL